LKFSHCIAFIFVAALLFSCNDSQGTEITNDSFFLDAARFTRSEAVINLNDSINLKSFHQYLKREQYRTDSLVVERFPMKFTEDKKW